MVSISNFQVGLLHYHNSQSFLRQTKTGIEKVVGLVQKNWFPNGIRLEGSDLSNAMLYS